MKLNEIFFFLDNQEKIYQNNLDACGTKQETVALRIIVRHRTARVTKAKIFQQTR